MLYVNENPESKQLSLNAYMQFSIHKMHKPINITHWQIH